MKVLFLFCVSLIFIIRVEGGGKFESFKKSSENFAIDLLKNLPNNQQNRIISPMSIQTVLALLQVGAVNKCLSELAHVLYLPRGRNKLSLIFQNSLTALNNDTNINMNIANKIYARNNFVMPKLYKRLAKIFSADVQEIDFSQPKLASNEINNWVKNQTKDKITNLISENTIDNDTVLLLINAIYFNANWQTPFDADMTMQRNFHVNMQETVKTNMMVQISHYLYKEDVSLDAKIVELPYQGEDFVMTIVLPNTKDGLLSFNEKKFNNIFDEDNFENVEVTVMIPKFIIENRVEFIEILEKLGLKSIFENLELKGVKSEGNMKVSQVLQKAIIDVNEVGTVAAAATAVEIEDRMGHFDRKFFIADHPFLFYIRQKSSGNVLFLGKFVKP